MEHAWIMHGPCDSMRKKSTAMYIDHTWKYMVHRCSNLLELFYTLIRVASNFSYYFLKLLQKLSCEIISLFYSTFIKFLR